MQPRQHQICRKNIPYVIKLQNPKTMSTTTNKAPMNIPIMSFTLATPKNLCLNRDFPDQTDFPGHRSLWDAANYNPASQGRQLPPIRSNSPIWLGVATNLTSAKAQNHLFLHQSLPWGNPFDLGDRVTGTNADITKVG
jgi:hypothetical protein